MIDRNDMLALMEGGRPKRQAERGKKVARQRGRNTRPRSGHENYLAMLWRMYKLTPEAYEALLGSQGGACATCGSFPTDKRLHVDHDHACCPTKVSCGKCVRGLLCMRCNLAMRDLDFAFASLEYLFDYTRRRSGEVVLAA